jgi:hypothetical protein
MSQETKDITNMALPGITIRNFVWIMSGIFTIVFSGIIGYYNIMRKLDGIDRIQSNINVIQTRVDNNTIELNNLQQHTIPSLDNRMSIMEEKMKDKMFIKTAP